MVKRKKPLDAIVGAGVRAVSEDGRVEQACVADLSDGHMDKKVVGGGTGRVFG